MLEARYAYVRIKFEFMARSNTPLEVVVGVEIDRNTPDLALAYGHVRNTLAPALGVLALVATDDELAERIEERVRRNWPGKSYFIEVGRGKMDEWVQVFEPKGHND